MVERLLKIVTVALILAFAAGAQAQEKKASRPWYLAITFGGSWYQDLQLSGAVNGKVSLDTGYTLNGAIGRYLGESRKFRLELEGVHNRSDVNQFNGASAGGTLYNYGFMFNALYDIHTNSKWVPYVGGGIGFTEATVDKLLISGTTAVDDSDIAFSWQLKAGIAYEFNPKMAATLGYRYFDTDDLKFGSVSGPPVTSSGTNIQNVEIGFRYSF